jgi:hypothetical protein
MQQLVNFLQDSNIQIICKLVVLSIAVAKPSTSFARRKGDNLNYKKGEKKNV